MNYVRAIKFSVGAYLVTLVLGILLNLFLGVDIENPFEVTTQFWMVNTLIMFILTVGFTVWYFQSDTTRATAKHGFLFGMILLVVGFALDALFIGLYLASGEASSSINPRALYMDMWFWIMVVVMFVSATMIGWMRKK